MFMAKTYQLMAWTDKGQVKMVPSLVAEMADPMCRESRLLRRNPGPAAKALRRDN